MFQVSYKLNTRILPLILGVFLSLPALADELLRSDHPSRYVVQKGDTLWDISGRFLRNPWDWPAIWQNNPQVQNPHLIYPGDELELVYIDGRPVLRIYQGPRVVKLSPTVRSTPWDGTVPTLPVDVISPFLTRSYVLTENTIDSSPYIVQFADEHLVGGAGHKAYVRNMDELARKYHVVRPGKPYFDAETGEKLGIEALFIGTAEGIRSGDPATVFFNSTQRESQIGDRLLAVEDDRPWTNFLPQKPRFDIKGAIIRVLDGVDQIGTYNVVVIDKGQIDGLQPGSVMLIEQRGEEIRDTVTDFPNDTVRLPNEKAGALMVFRTFDRVSYALVMNAERSIHLNDIVRTP